MPHVPANTTPLLWKIPLFAALFFLALARGPAAPPADYETTLREGLLALNAKDLAAARQKLEQASQMPGADARAWLGLADTYGKSNEPARADQAAAKALELSPDDPVVLHALAMQHAAAGHWQQAAELEEKFARQRPGDAAALSRAARFYLRASSPDKAIELIRQGLARENSADLQVLLAQASVVAGRPKEAVEPLQEAIRLQPYEERLYFELGRLLLRLQDLDGALDVIARGQKIFDKSPQLELLRGIALYSQRKFPEAVDSFLRSAELAPDLKQPHAFLGRILSHAHHRLERITARFAAFAAANPDHYLGHYLYAIALLEGMGPAVQPEVAAKAQAELERAIELKEDHADSHFELGVLLAKQGDYPRAAQHLERCVALTPTSSKAHYHLARVYTRLGETEKARAELELHEKLTEKERQAMRSGMAPAEESAVSDVVQ